MEYLKPLTEEVLLARINFWLAFIGYTLTKEDPVIGREPRDADFYCLNTKTGTIIELKMDLEQLEKDVSLLWSWDYFVDDQVLRECSRR
jgi:hypothetical protein